MTRSIVVLGSLNADLVVRVPRFPSPGETVTGTDLAVFAGGKGANQACAVGRLGTPVHMVGRVGADGNGALLRASLDAAGVDTTGVVADEAAPTGTALITIDASGQNEIVIVAGANGRVSPADVERSRGLIQGAAFLLLQLEVPLPAVEAAARAARAAGVTVILDPAPARPEALGLLALADYVTPNESELLTLCGERPQAMGPDEAAGLARRLLARGAHRVVAKLGPLGALLVSEERTSRWPGVAVQAVDTTGAGDVWNAGFATALAEGATEDAAGAFANAAAAVSVTRQGAQPSMPTRSEVESRTGRRLLGAGGLLVMALLAAVAGAEPAGSRRISQAALLDKIRGGWAGQMIGVSYGAPTEFKSNGRIIEGEIAWSPERVENAIHQDDLYVEMTFAEVMDRLGLGATTEQYGEMFKDSKYSLWHANAGARRNLNRGIKAPRSGHPDYNVHANDIDFQIESDFIGLMTPGLPQEANRYADRVGRVMNYGDGLYGGMFFGGMYAAAFFESEPRKVVEQGLLSIPPDSGYARIIRDVLGWSAQHPDDWRKTWQLIEDRWDKDDACPDGARTPFNIDARLNGAYVALGLLYGKGDFAKTLEVSTRSGQDSDCNPSSAAGILGVILGYDRIPDVWKSGIPKLADTKFEFTSYSFNEIVRSTLKRALQVVEGAGGRVSATEVELPAQAPKAPPLEQWDAGVPRKRAEIEDPDWGWKGAWAEEALKGGGSSGKVRQAVDAGDEAIFTFEGTGVAIVGHCSQESGRADVYLDGARAGEIDAWIPERTYDNDYWHVTGLAPGRHTVRIVVRGDSDSRSAGRKIEIQRAIVYGAR